MSEKHTAKSVGLSEAFPATGSIAHNGEMQICYGMNVATYLYAGFVTINPEATTGEVKNVVDIHLHGIADMLNELEEMKS